jgi:hypothetical protein
MTVSTKVVQIFLCGGITVVKCPKCNSTSVLKTYDVLKHETVDVNTGEVVEVAEGNRKVSEDLAEFYCADCFNEWGRA